MADNDNDADKTETSLPALEWLDVKDNNKNRAYFSTYFSKVSGIETVAILNNQSTLYAITRVDAFRASQDCLIKDKEGLNTPGASQDCLGKSSTFTFEDRYSAITF